MIHGMLNVYKEEDFTSHDVVAKLRGICKQKKIGHTGTLDPKAVGVLPVCLGKATKLCDMLTDKNKTYKAVLQLGVTTDTEDLTGKILTKQEVNVSEEQVRLAILSFLGEQMQIPPMYSALKVNGKKLYELARQGKVIERKPRPITIHNIEILEINLPYATFNVSCSKGTYIRSLCRDIGEQLGCGGAMKSLTRIQVGDFLIQDSLTLDQIEKLVKDGTLEQYLRPIDFAFMNYAKVEVKVEADKRIWNGNTLYRTDLETLKEQFELDEIVRVYNKQQEFMALYQYTTEEEESFFKPYKMFLPDKN